RSRTAAEGDLEDVASRTAVGVVLDGYLDALDTGRAHGVERAAIARHLGGTSGPIRAGRLRGLDRLDHDRHVDVRVRTAIGLVVVQPSDGLAVWERVRPDAIQ